MIRIFTDGSSKGNPGPGGWGAIIQKSDKVIELGGPDKHTTNNRMEMTAIAEALEFVGNTEDQISIFTDSKYTIDGITKWVTGWQRNGWLTKNKTEVLNKDLWQRLHGLVQNKNISWNHVAGHVGIPGNERVDTIANGFASEIDVPLFEGLAKDYKISLDQVTSTSPKNKSKGGTAFSYMALVDGEVHRFRTWSECESFVKGKQARFRKATSQEHEKEILKDWGVLN